MLSYKLVCFYLFKVLKNVLFYESKMPRRRHYLLFLFTITFITNETCLQTEVFVSMCKQLQKYADLFFSFSVHKILLVLLKF